MKSVMAESSTQISAPAEREPIPPRLTLRHRCQYWAALAVLQTLGWLPHKLARYVCASLAALCYWFWPRLRSVGLFNLRLAFPQWSEAQRRHVIFGLFQNFGRTLADLPISPTGIATTLKA